MRYDPLGRLHEVKKHGGGYLLDLTRFLYDGPSTSSGLLVAEFDGAGNVIARHVHGPAAGADDPLVSYESPYVALGYARMLYADPRGSIVFRSDSAGTSNHINTYDEYGQPADANVGRFQYTGQVWLDELGMSYYKARIYAPRIGRFMQTDPIGYEDNINLYAYVGNDPVNGVDPTGMQACDGEKSCIEANNFKADKTDGQTVTQSENIDDAARQDLPGIETEHSPDERVVAFTESEDGGVQTTEITPTSQGEKGGTIETKAEIPAGAQSIGHSHPNQDSSIAPGPGDDSVVNNGMPNNIANNGAVIVVEKVNGQFRVRILSGNPSKEDRREIRNKLRTFQRRVQ